MTSEFHAVPGERIGEGELTHPRAIATLRALRDSPYACLCDVRRWQERGRVYEGLIAMFSPEIPQDTVHDIRPKERLALVFADSNDHFPTVLALRRDFPVVPHLNAVTPGTPKSLCLDERPWPEARLTWTAGGFLRDIGGWLSQTAVGTLHAEDQRLEPFLFAGAGVVVLPENLLEGEPTGVAYTGIGISEKESGPLTVRLESVEEGSEQTHAAQFYCVPCVGEPTVHGVIHDYPENFSQLKDILSLAGIDLIGLLKSRIPRLYREARPPRAEDRLILVVQLPRKRRAGGPVEHVEWMAFGVLSVRDAAVATGWFGRQPDADGVSPLLEQRYDEDIATDVPIMPFRVVQAMTRDLARCLSGLSCGDDASDPRIALIGGGALGSQIHNHLSRMGWGRWSIIDEDVLYPHNAPRHRLGSQMIGLSKAKGLQVVTGLDTPYNPVDAHFESVLGAASKGPILDCLQHAEVILDVSTSVAVARFLASDIDSPARRISAFLSPQGTEAVMLLEDRARNFQLDIIEAQYYRTVLRSDELRTHLRLAERLRYSAGCRDVTSRIGQDQIALAGGLLARQLRSVTDDAGAWVWKLEDDGSVRRIAVPLSDTIRLEAGDWRIVTDEVVVAAADRYRNARLPAETGGILLGYFDVERHRIYVVDMLPAPPDSTEHRTAFIRGAAGLQDALADISSRTAGQVVYVGEWHAHPRGAGVGMSPDDRKLLATISDEVRADGWPGVMMIIGDRQRIAFYIQGDSGED